MVLASRLAVPSSTTASAVHGPIVASACFKAWACLLGPQEGTAGIYLVKNKLQRTANENAASIRRICKRSNQPKINMSN